VKGLVAFSLESALVADSLREAADIVMERNRKFRLESSELREEHIVEKGKHQTFRLVGALSLLFLLSTSLKAQQSIDISPEVAASHLLKKVAPVYPAFAMAAGMGGVVHVAVGINQSGRVVSYHVKSGSPPLRDAATAAVSHYVYQPFEQDGHPVIAQTTVDVVFRLEDQRKISPPPPPELTTDSFTLTDAEDDNVQISPEFRKWLGSDLQKMFDESSCPASAFRSAKAADTDTATKLLNEATIVDLPTKNTTVHVYFVGITMSCMCGATGNCSILLVEENGSDVHPIAETSGWGYYVRLRQGSAYPDIFIASHMSASETDVAGFANLAGEWGQLYCGAIFGNGQSEKNEVHVCQ